MINPKPRTRNWTRRPADIRREGGSASLPLPDSAASLPAESAQPAGDLLPVVRKRIPTAMKTTSSNPVAGNIEPSVHLEFIQNQVESPTSASIAAVEQYHRSLFLHRYGVEWEKSRQQARAHEEKVAMLEGQLKATQASLSGKTKFVPVTVDGQEDTKPTSLWNAWDMLMFAACLLGILALMAFGVWNISFNLLESGLITFRENPLRSYLWAALLPVGALAIKVGWDFVQDRRRRELYLWACLIVGMIGVFSWAGAYACVYPSLSKGIGEHIASLSVFDHATSATGAGLNFAGAKWIDVITVAGQAVAEIFLSAVLGMYLTTLYARHRPVRLAEDPAFVQLSRESRELEAVLTRERIALGEATGNILRLEHMLAALVAYSASVFQRETAQRKDQAEKRQVILDHLSEHLRTHLESAEPPRRLATATATPGVLQRNGS